MMTRHRATLLGLACLAGLAAGCLRSAPPVPPPPPVVIHRINPGPNVQEEAQTALIKAKPGEVVEFGEGTFEFTRGLSLAVEGVTVRGKGMDKTILSFKKQDADAAGLLVTRGSFVLEDLTVEDTKKDGVKVSEVDGVVFRRVRAQWTGGDKETNGAYGLYPVLCKNVLIEDCVAIGASDAGIYVGQSRNVIVRRCRAERNVAGIEIENTTDADVYENVATNNAGGLLVFDLPGLQEKNGKRVRVHSNQVFANNHENFAPKGTTVAGVPPGMGMMVMATDQVEVFKNTIKDNQTCNLAVVSYHITDRKIEDKDKEYDPISESVYIHDNTFVGGGDKPEGDFGQLFKILLGQPVPDIIYDGVVNPAKLIDGRLPSDLRLVLKNNVKEGGEVGFANLKLAELGPIDRSNLLQALTKLAAHKPKVERDPKPFEGELPALPPVTLPGIR